MKQKGNRQTELFFIGMILVIIGSVLVLSVIAEPLLTNMNPFGNLISQLNTVSTVVSG